MPKRQAREIRRTKYYKHLKRCVEERLTVATDATEASARTLANMRHVCDELQVDYGIADMLGGYYYLAESKEKELR